MPYFYDGPHVFDIKPKSGPAYGSQKVTITGSNFGDPIEDKDVSLDVFIGNGTCENATRVSQTELTCITPLGTARDNVVRVHVGITQGLSHENATYHYRIPYVHCVDYSHGELFGGYNISVLGRDFGTAQEDPKVSSAVSLAREPCTSQSIIWNVRFRQHWEKRTTGTKV